MGVAAMGRVPKQNPPFSRVREGPSAEQLSRQ